MKVDLSLCFSLASDLAMFSYSICSSKRILAMLMKGSLIELSSSRDKSIKESLSSAESNNDFCE